MNRERKYVGAYSVISVAGLAFLLVLPEFSLFVLFAIAAFSFGIHELVHFFAARLMQLSASPLPLSLWTHGWSIDARRSIEAVIVWFAPLLLAPAYYLTFALKLQLNAVVVWIVALTWTLMLSWDDLQNFFLWRKGRRKITN